MYAKITPNLGENKTTYSTFHLSAFHIYNYSNIKQIFSLLKVLESLANIIQNKHNYEIIVVDNNSSDETKELTLNFIKKFNSINIRYIFESTPGLLAVRHRGLDVAVEMY